MGLLVWDDEGEGLCEYALVLLSRDRRTDAAWSNSSGTKATRYGAILCLSQEIHRSTHIYSIYNNQ